MKNSLLVSVLFLILSCQEKEIKILETGTYRGNLIAQDNQAMPFLFEVTSKNTLKIYNVDEVIEVDEITYRNDSVFIKLPYFETVIAAKFDGNDFHGQWIEEDRDRSVAFNAEYNVTNRFDVKTASSVDVSGVWEMEFNDYGKHLSIKSSIRAKWK